MIKRKEMSSDDWGDILGSILDSLSDLTEDSLPLKILAIGAVVAVVCFLGLLIYKLF